MCVCVCVGGGGGSYHCVYKGRGAVGGGGFGSCDCVCVGGGRSVRGGCYKSPKYHRCMSVKLI